MSDVWSFGILFWEIVTFGDTPYKNELSPKVFMELIKVIFYSITATSL